MSYTNQHGRYICKKCKRAMTLSSVTTIKNRSATYGKDSEYRCDSCGRTYTHHSWWSLLGSTVFAYIGLDVILSFAGFQSSIGLDWSNQFKWFEYIFFAGLAVFSIVYIASVPREIYMRITGNMER